MLITRLFTVCPILLLNFFHSTVYSKSLFFYADSIVATLSCTKLKLFSIGGNLLSDQNFQSCDSTSNDPQLISFYRNTFYHYSSANGIIASISSNENAEFAVNLLANKSLTISSEHITGVSLTDNFVYHAFEGQDVLLEARDFLLGLEGKMRISGVLEYRTIGHFYEYPFFYMVVSMKVQSSGITKHQSSLIRFGRSTILHCCKGGGGWGLKSQ